MSAASPIAAGERIASLDVLRGFALLGILVMNIQSFSMPGAAYLNPTAYGDLTGVNLWVWVTSHVFFDQKFLSLFSMLFGAGVLVFADRASARGAPVTRLHYRRNFWLLFFGLLHAHLLWYGDILYSYAMCAFLVYLFRNRSPRVLLALGLAFFSVGWLISLLSGFSLPLTPQESLEMIRQAWSPSAAELQAEIAAFTGSAGERLAYNSIEALILETVVFLTLVLWRVSGLMLVGMALYRWGVLSAERSDRFYRRLLLAGLLVGLPLIGIGLARNFAAGFSMEYSFYFGSLWNYWGSVALALSYLSLIMLVVRSGAFAALQARLTAVGKTAFSNYILQTVICTWIFYGFGLGLFGAVERWLQVLIVFGVWAVQLWISPLWLARYRFGPLEWLWRSLTYRQRQPLRRREAGGST